jgi:hypothetical protein
MKKVALVLFVLTLFAIDVNAQCAMCGAVAESAQKNGSQMAEGLNAGILYLMGIPYILIIGTGILLFRRLNRNKTSAQ